MALDRRDETTWVTLELTRAGEAKALDGTLAAAIRSELGVPKDFPVFVPYAPYAKNVKNVSILIEGYAFVPSGLPETRYFALENKALVVRVLSSKGPHGIRVLKTIPNFRVLEMQKQLRLLVSADVEQGMTVRVTGGCYAHIEATVVDVYEDSVAVRIPLRSIDVITVIPKSSINLNLDEDELPPIEHGEGDFDSYEEHAALTAASEEV